MTRKFVIHHVGGRGGSRSFPVLPKFERDIVSVMYDADASCVEQVAENNAALESKLIVVPRCLDERSGFATFHSNFDPYSSSLLETADLGGFYLPMNSVDYVMADGLRTVQSEELPTVTLDDLLAEDPTIPAPDFLSLDTQGTELAIIRGASNALHNVVAIVSEVEFRPLYVGQPLFGDVCRELGAMGFEFVRFLGFPEHPPHRGPIGARGSGYHLFSEALFVRRPDDCDRHKLAFAALVLGQVELALSCRVEAAGDSTWERFVDRFWATAAGLPSAMPPTFAELHSRESSWARFQISREPSERSSRSVRSVVARVPGARQVRRSVIKMRNKRARPTAVERLLLEHGLDDVAAVVRRRTLAEVGSSR